MKKEVLDAIDTIIKNEDEFFKCATFANIKEMDNVIDKINIIQKIKYNLVFKTNMVKKIIIMASCFANFKDGIIFLGDDRIVFSTKGKEPENIKLIRTEGVILDIGSVPNTDIVKLLCLKYSIPFKMVNEIISKIYNNDNLVYEDDINYDNLEPLIKHIQNSDNFKTKNI